MKAPSKRTTRRPAPPQPTLDLREPGQPTLGEVWRWFEKEHVNGGEQRLATQRGYRSTFSQALAHFGEHAVPTVGESRSWLAHRVAAGELTRLSANGYRDRLHAAYHLYAEQARRITLNPWTFRRFKEDERQHLRGGMEAADTTWPELLAALPDDRARAFVSLLGRLGWRMSEPLGLEWKHIDWNAPGGPTVRKEQQRNHAANVPEPLKFASRVGTFRLHPETVGYLKAARRALRESKPQVGCAQGTLVGTEPGLDGEVRQFIFPYRELHLAELMGTLRRVAPKEFPKGQAWHRLRRFVGTLVAQTFGVEAAKRLLGHENISTTQLYCQQVVGVQATGKDMDELFAAQDALLAPSGTARKMLLETESTSDNAKGVVMQPNQVLAGKVM